MKNLVDLQDAIQHDLAWRKREISDLRAAAARADESERYIFRSGQVLLCAHWEGFLKQSSKLYLDHVFSQDISLRDCSANIVAIAYFKDVTFASGAKYPGSPDHHIRLANKIVNSINSNIDAPAWKVDTEGNPGTDVLERILRSIGVNECLGMDPAEWSTTRVFINEQLIKDRHAIAHGEQLPIKKDSLLDRSDRLLRLLDALNEILMSSATNMLYRACVT